MNTLNTKLLFFVVSSNLYGIKCVKASSLGLLIEAVIENSYRPIDKSDEVKLRLFET